MKMIQLFSWRVFIAFGALSAWLSGGSTVVAAGPSGASITTNGLSVVHVGNSQSHPLGLLVPLARQLGHADFKEAHVNILGATLGWLWPHPEGCNWPTTLAATKKWDAITLLATNPDRADDCKFAPKFAGEVYKGNPKCQVFIYQVWPNAQMDFEKPPVPCTEKHGEAVADAVAKEFPNAPPPRVIPSSLLVRELGRLADRGELPHVNSRFAMYADGGHLSQYGMYAINVLVMAMLYQESPLAYPADIYRVDPWGRPDRGMYRSVTVPEDTAEVIKRMAWDILQTYPRAGMKPMLAIANRRLEPVIAGRPCKVELKALNAAGPCAWSILKGRLPAGLSLSRDGVLAGQSVAVGDYPLTIQLANGKDRCERPLVLQVAPDKPPVIPNQPLKTVSLDQYVFQPLKIDGGVGHITWNLRGGKLPHGLMLSPAGILVGSPGEAGEFTFTIGAEDSFPGGPRRTEQALTWTIGPALPTTLLVKFVPVDKPGSKRFGLDCKQDDPIWPLDQAIDKKVKGTPTKHASFGAVWINGRRCLVVAVKVLDGPKGKTPKDGVHIFIDGNHDRRIIYGSDDTHFFVPRTFKGIWAECIRGKVNWFTNVKVKEIEGGYIMEISLEGGSYFGGEGNWVKFGPKGVYGLDLAVDEGEGKQISQQVWRGDANDAEDTSHFGTIVLVDEPAVPAAKAIGQDYPVSK